MASSLLNIGSRALAAAQGSLATISHNISNANTAGYSRQEAVLATAGGTFTGSGFFGRGVDLTTVQRNYDQFLTAAVQSTASAAAADSARASGLEQLDSLFSDSSNGIGAALSDFFAAAGDLANRPADLSTRQVFIGRVSQLADRITTVGRQLSDMLQTADARLVQDATQVNSKLTEIRQLNERIAQTSASGQPPNDLLDQRDAALQALNGFLSVRTVENPSDHTLSVFTASGEPMLVGSQQAQFAGVADPANPAHIGIRMTVGGSTTWIDAAAAAGGSIAGTLQLRDEDLTSAINAVGHLAAVAGKTLNDQQALGIDMGNTAGAALLKIPDPVALAEGTNQGTGKLAVTFASATALQPSDYEVSWDGTQYSIRRLTDNQLTSGVSFPTTVDGLQFTASGAPVAGDKWIVQPYTPAATGLAARPIGPRQIATAYASTIVAGAANKGTAAASGFAIVRAAPENTLGVSITFNNPPTTYNVTGLSGGPIPPQAYVPGARVPAAPADYNGWSVVLDGVPAAGDSFNVGAVANPASDNRNALSLANLASTPLAGGATLNNAYASLVADVGTRVQTGRASAEVSGRLASEATSRQQNIAGVNLDEEAANLLRFQQAYQASAKIIQASQTLFESLLSAAG
jgi:flagellar hook-associated protein 1 FlgK